MPTHKECIQLRFGLLLREIVASEMNNRDFTIQRRDDSEKDAQKVNLRSCSLYRNYFSL